MAYKLRYFNSRGRAEVIRMLLSEAGQKFKDERLELDDWDEEIRKGTQTGFLPSLEDDDGFLVSSSLGIARYLARKYGLLGNTEQDAASIDMIMDLLYDYESHWSEVNWEDDPEIKAWLQEKAEGYSRTLDTLERLLTENGGKHFVGNKLSAADIMALSILETYRDHLTGDKQPNLIKLIDHVAQRPRIQNWIKHRPETDF